MGSGSSRSGSASSTKSAKTTASNNVRKPVPKPVAFEVDVGVGHSSNKTKPKRIQELERADSSNKLTADDIDDKLRQAEDNRLKNLDRVREMSRRSARPRRTNPPGNGQSRRS